MSGKSNRPLKSRCSLAAELVRIAALGGLLLGMVACVPPDGLPAAPKTLTVFAAASLRDAMEAIGELYEQAHPETDVVFNFAASSALRAQLGEGAAADVAAFAAERTCNSWPQPASQTRIRRRSSPRTRWSWWSTLRLPPGSRRSRT